MSTMLKLVLLLVSLVIFFSTLRLVKQDKIPVKYSLVWLLSAFVLFFVAVFTNAFGYITQLIGFQVSSNLVIAIFITFLLLITRMLTKIVSEQNKKINMLIQEMSILKEKVGK